MSIKSSKVKYLVCLILILTAVAVGYSNSLKGDFQFDDDVAVTGNSAVQNPERFLQLDGLSGYFSGGRPVTALTFAVNYALGGKDVAGYHVVNLFIHMLVVLLLYIFTGKTLRLAGWSNPEIPALITAGIFGLHPLQSAAVSYISQRAELLASLFYISALLIFIRARNTGFNTKGIFMYFPGLALFLLGLGAKEIVITLPAVFLLYDFYFLDKKPLLRRIAAHAPFVIAGLIYFAVRLSGMKGNTDVGFDVKAISSPEYLMTQFNVVMTYLRLIMLPINQNLDYDYPVSRNLFEMNTLLSFTFLVLLCLLAIACKSRNKIVSFGIMWFLIVISPTSSFVPVIDVIYEHRTYLALWGIITALTAVAVDVYRRLKPEFSFSRAIPVFSGVIAVSVVIVVMAEAGTALYERNKVWHSKLSLWKDVVSKSPEKPRARNNLGNCYFIRNHFEAAIPQYRKAIALDPKWYESYYNLAMSLEKTGRNKEAVYYYLVFLREAPSAYNKQKMKIMKKYNISG